MKNIVFILLTLSILSCGKSELSSTDGTTGVNGSITRFAINGNYMYAIDFNYLKTFDISNSDHPVFVNSVKVDYGLETIFIYDNYIYLGANDGVYVISISNPANPVQLQKIQHQISCDPVVVQGNYAYSTQRVNAVGCGNIWNVSTLAVYDVTNPEQAILTTTIPMVRPYGLAVKSQWLYVCDPGNGGIIVYDIFTPSNPIEIATVNVVEPRDIILLDSYMIVVTKTKFELYNYSDPLNIYLISTLNIT